MPKGQDLEVLLETRFLRVVRRDGWEYVQRRNVAGIVVVVALTRERELLLVEQWRAAMDAQVIELPAGLADIVDGRAEPLDEAAGRELLEETGYRATQLVPLFHGPPSPGITSEDVIFFLAPAAEQVAAGGGNPHEREKIRVHAVPLESAAAWLDEQAAGGRLVDVKVYAGLYAARNS